MTVALVESAALRVRQSPLVPALGRPERVLDRVLSGVGLTTATWFFAASLVPSLLPRAAWLQGLVSGVTVAVGYGLGAGAAALWRYLGIPGLRGRARTLALWILIGVGAWGAVWNGWRLVGWQNEIRAMFGMPPTSPLIWPVIVAVTLGVALLLLLAERSGSPKSLAAWEDLGFYGRRFVRSGPSVAQLEAVNGPGAKEPIRVYAGLQSADTVQGRADLVLAELKRTGAFDRKVLVIATTTGMGYLDSRGTDPLEYLWNGDTAIAGVQYSYLPSWISLLADQEAVVDTSQTVFETVRQYWATLPASERPSLYLYGLSLGSMGVESVLTSVNIVNEPVDGALMVGPPFLNEMHRRLERDRDAGSPASLPVYEDGRTVRFTNEQEPLQPVTGAWGPTRVAYLQHASDPVVFFSSDLAFDRPEWLADGQRGPDVSPTMGWVPLVTMWQVLLDMPGAGSVPTGYGHMYSARANLAAWAAVTQPPGWSDTKAEAIGAALGNR